eukprot:GILI01031225.1.p1 GENE.GILI01031225.1~~GILI01031225.1.p1  ORF type:complete len:269 (-),score=33.15 GILI01031225.1:86-892(-)
MLNTSKAKTSPHESASDILDPLSETAKGSITMIEEGNPVGSSGFMPPPPPHGQSSEGEHRPSALTRPTFNVAVFNTTHLRHVSPLRTVQLTTITYSAIATHSQLLAPLPAPLPTIHASPKPYREGLCAPSIQATSTERGIIVSPADNRARRHIAESTPQSIAELSPIPATNKAEGSKMALSIAREGASPVRLDASPELSEEWRAERARARLRASIDAEQQALEYQRLSMRYSERAEDAASVPFTSRHVSPPPTYGSLLSNGLVDSQAL